MFTFAEGSANPGLVLIGILIAQLFLYGRKVKANTKIQTRDLLGDVMQLGVVFVTCMGFVRIADGVMGFHIQDAWQLITVVIVFNMSFDTFFTKLRAGFDRRIGAAVDILLGNAPPTLVPPPMTPQQEQLDQEVGAPLREIFQGTTEADIPQDMQDSLDKMP